MGLLMFSVSGEFTPDCTLTSTVPEPVGTTAVTCESFTTVTFVAAVVAEEDLQVTGPLPRSLSR